MMLLSEITFTSNDPPLAVLGLGVRCMVSSVLTGYLGCWVVSWLRDVRSLNPFLDSVNETLLTAMKIFVLMNFFFPILSNAFFVTQALISAEIIAPDNDDAIGIIIGLSGLFWRVVVMPFYEEYVLR